MNKYFVIKDDVPYKLTRTRSWNESLKQIHRTAETAAVWEPNMTVALNTVIVIHQTAYLNSLIKLKLEIHSHIRP